MFTFILDSWYLYAQSALLSEWWPAFLSLLIHAQHLSVICHTKWTGSHRSHAGTNLCSRLCRSIQSSWQPFLWTGGGRREQHKNIWSISPFVPAGVFNHHYYHDDDVCTRTGPGITGFTLAQYEEPEMCHTCYLPSTRLSMFMQYSSSLDGWWTSVLLDFFSTSTSLATRSNVTGLWVATRSSPSLSLKCSFCVGYIW